MKIVVAAAASLLLTSVSSAQAPNPLVGAWSLVETVQVRPDGRTNPLTIMTGSVGAKGLIIYSADGMMSVQIAGAGRPSTVNAGSGTIRTYTPDAARAVLGSYYGYFGRYEYDSGARKIRHIIAQSLHPDETGITYTRSVAIDGDRLMLETERYDEGGEQRFNRLTWRRVESSSRAPTGGR